MNGLALNAPKYSIFSKMMVPPLLYALRPIAVLPDDAVKEARFNSDDHVTWLLESNYSEIEFMTNPVAACQAMLIEAAKSDNWYKYEKDYDDDMEVEE